MVCARWEERDIVEWVQYHRAVGFDHIFLYSNDDDPMPTFRALTPFLYGADAFITFQHYPKRRPGQPQQPDIYFHFLRHHKHKTEWFSMLDADEFFVFKGVNNVHAFMAEFENDCDALYFNWLVYGSAGKLKRDFDSVLLSHTLRTERIDVHTKMITRSAIISETEIKNKFGETHKSFWHFWAEYHIPDIRLVNVLHDNMAEYSANFPTNALTYVRTEGVSDRLIAKAYVAHFQFKSEEDFMRRVARGGSHTNSLWKKAFEDGSYKKRLLSGNNRMDVYLAQLWLGQVGEAFNFMTEIWVPVPNLPNVALRKPTRQSSVNAGSEEAPPYSWPVGHANDGVRTGGYGFATNHEDRPWWMIDLLAPHAIAEIHIYNRVDTPEFAARASRIAVASSDDSVNWTRIFALDGKTPVGGIRSKPLVIRPEPPVQARYIRILSPVPTTLHLDEVEIYGSALQQAAS
jgi:hypothetical protein